MAKVTSKSKPTQKSASTRTSPTKKSVSKDQYQSGRFGTIYPQFQDKPKEAISFLMKHREGECIKALHRHDIGYIDIVWGENDQNNKGYGLKHIVEKHGGNIEALGFKIEDFIPIVVQFGEFNETISDAGKKVFESKMFRFVVATNFEGRRKQWLLTSFDIRKKPRKKSQA